ncbi:MAG: hypothetical protein JNL42_07810 [Anaerolineae bacterium]|nr:hypothetical protein [Anaerolineae bacterium]
MQAVSSPLTELPAPACANTHCPARHLAHSRCAARPNEHRADGTDFASSTRQPSAYSQPIESSGAAAHAYTT